MSRSAPRVWVLLGERRGDNNQLLALAEALSLPFETKTLSYNWLRHLPFLNRFGLTILSRRSRPLITPPWPDLVMSVAHSGLAPARFIKKQADGRTRLVHIGNPHTAIDDLSLVILTPQFVRKAAPNVLRIALPMGNPARTTPPSDEEKLWLNDYPRPRRLVAVGGATRKWQISHSQLEQAVERLQSRRAHDGGSIIAVTSPRTTSDTKVLLQSLLRHQHETVVDDFPRFPVLLAESDECFVTADSVSMLAEAIVTGKPVGMIPIEPTVRGWFNQRLRRYAPTVPVRAELPRFWDFLMSNKLVGTVDQPVASAFSDTVGSAVDAVRRILDER